MKVLLYSHAFHPSTGGVETVSMALAEGFTRRGIECKVVTRTPRDPAQEFPFELIDNPRTAQIRALVRWADVILFNGASLALQPWVLLSRKPFLWVHVGYQAGCIDGAGWHDNQRTPLTPWASFLHHFKRDPLTGLRDGFKLQDFVEKTGLPFTAIQKGLDEAERKGLIARDFVHARPTERGFDFLNDLQSLFLAD